LSVYAGVAAGRKRVRRNIQRKHGGFQVIGFDHLAKTPPRPSRCRSASSR